MSLFEKIIIGIIFPPFILTLLMFWFMLFCDLFEDCKKVIEEIKGRRTK